jgi:SPP1 family predicted phage head-tail adaptor
MKAGKLRHSILIQKKVVFRNSIGEEEVTYEDFALVYASIEPIGGREYFLAQQTQSAVDYKFMMRYRSGIKPDFRIFWGTRIFNITSVLNLEERNTQLMLYCREQITP